MRVSVIVPIYNAEKYLRECLESILTQEITDMEILCVNDGSTDGSSAILDAFARRDHRVRIINKANTGYGDSVNIGIEHACGDYIALLESDDQYVRGILPELLALAEEIQADVVKGNYYLWFSDENRCELYDNMKAYADGEVIGPERKTDLYFSACALWSAVYNREFIKRNRIRFLPTPGASYQDTAFSFKVWACAEKIAAVKKPVVLYRQDNALSSSNESGKIFNICDEFREIEKFISERKLDNAGPIYARVMYISYFWNVNRLQTEKKIEFLDGVYEELAALRERGWLQKDLWNEGDWRVINSCISDFEGFKSALKEGKNIWEAACS